MSAQMTDKQGFHAWVAHTLAERALLSAVRLLRAADLPIVPVKGLALSHWLYSDAMQRPFRDLDLLIPRGSFIQLRNLVEENGYRVTYVAEELGELTFEVDGFLIDLHAEFGFRDFTALGTDQVIRRATSARLLGHDVLRIDEIDHLILLAVNVTKDGFQAASAHHREDLRRLLSVLVSTERIPELVVRIREAGFVTGLHNIALWMAIQYQDPEFASVLAKLDTPRLVYSSIVGIFCKIAAERRRQPWGLLLGCWSNDRLTVRSRSLARMLRRGMQRLLGMARP